MKNFPQLLRFHYDLRTHLTRYSIPYLWLKRWQQRYLLPQAARGETSGHIIKWGAIEKDTEIVIEGYPRSGNTFASSAFRLAQNRPIKIAYRLHASTQLITAVHLKIPAIALIRKPEDAVLSWVIHRSHLTLEQAIKGYISFHEAILPHCNYFIIADFETVINNFGVIIRAVNKKFDTTFQEFVHTEENVQKCFIMIDNFYRESGRGKISNNIVARPAQERNEAKIFLRQRLKAPNLQSLMGKADALYEQILQYRSS
ncbi:hypothetical protein PCC7418_1860 [Halothece sp. PCC 7418]|uniref:hypothetical protein n=1 Tax=Halothece sp. (strain PCC 7418) TaxID=65093 RepID=UPI0002A08944|nr:hypothetical protein [Halothece sp. PCC 7418]AFZ44028.1 hypothetical protein PCC7418_1860 [Halothece sp. PCC 7418]